MVWLLVVLAPLGFALLWFTTLKLIAVLGGWTTLAKRYACDEPPPGKVFRWQSAGIGWCNYNNCLTMVAGLRGLYLKPMWGFSIGHTPLLIPWEELRDPKPHWLTKRIIKVRVGEPTILVLGVPLRVLQTKPLADGE